MSGGWQGSWLCSALAGGWGPGVHPHVPCEAGSQGWELYLGPQEKPLPESGLWVGTRGQSSAGLAEMELQSPPALQLVIEPGECKCLGCTSVVFLCLVCYVERGEATLHCLDCA